MTSLIGDPGQRRTLKNFWRMLAGGNYKEMLKVLRRRSINAFRFMSRVAWRVLGLVLDQPSIKSRRQKRQLANLLKKYYGFNDDQAADAKLQIAIIARDGSTYPKSSAFIRLVGPLTDETLQDKLTLHLYPENTTELPLGTNLCVVQRNAFDKPATAERLLNNLRQPRIPLVIDTDDAFQSMDPSHPEHGEHTPTLEAFNLLLESADQVWVSTRPLARMLGKAGSKTVVIRNSLDPRVWRGGHGSRRPASGPIQMLYMGTVSHDADFAMVFPVLDRLAAEQPGAFELTVVGVASDLPDRTWIKRLYQKKGSIYPRFVSWYLDQGPFDIGLSPLVDSQFNRAKSDIKCLDYLAAGIVPVVSDIEPYDPPELNQFIIRARNSDADWENKLAAIISRPDEFRDKYAPKIKAAQDYIWRERSSTVTARRLLEQLRKLGLDLQILNLLSIFPAGHPAVSSPD